MSSALDVHRYQEEQTRAYREAVIAVERELGVSLPVFHGVAYCFAGYEKPRHLGQAPYYRRFPKLTAKPWWERDAFPPEARAVLARFEEDFAELQEEFEAGIPAARGAFDSQVTGYFGAVDQWLSYTLVTEDGEPVPAAVLAFPKLSRLLRELVDMHFVCKTYFALMRDGVHLEPHCGGHNIALRMHLGLRIPPGDASITVGGVTHGWENGKELFFDDTFVHEAHNRTGQDRYIMLMRILHPELSLDERKAYFRIERAFRASPVFKAQRAEVLAAKARGTAPRILPAESATYVLGRSPFMGYGTPPAIPTLDARTMVPVSARARWTKR